MSIFSLNCKVNPKALAVGNVFADKLYMVVNSSVYPANKVATFDLSRKGSKKGTVNIAAMPAIQKGTGYTLLDEIAEYRAKTVLPTFTDSDISKHKSALFLDYLLAMSLCYVEIDNPNYNPNVAYSQRVEKFFATRNINILQLLCPDKVEERRSRLLTFLGNVDEEYRSDSIRLIKVTNTKTGYSITQPKNPIKVGKNVRVMPVFLLNSFLNHIEAQLMLGIMEFKYSKDDKSVRTLVSTLNPVIYNSYYNDAAYTQKVISGKVLKMNRGYIKIPELGLSRYDESGLRSLNLLRVISMRPVTSVDTHYIDVNINGIVPAFIEGLNRAYSAGTINKLYEKVLQTPCKVNGAQAWDALKNWVDTQVMLGTTVFLKKLHDLMLSSKEFFPNYTGKVAAVNSVYSNGFGDLGIG